MSFHDKSPLMDIQFNKEELQILRDALREFRFGDHRLARTDDRYKLQQRIEKTLWYGTPIKNQLTGEVICLRKST